jgi:hypothetical protein
MVGHNPGKPSSYRVRDAVFDVAEGSVDCTPYPVRGAR